MAKRKVRLTSEWIENWRPTTATEIPDADCRGLFLWGGPSGAKTFYRWQQVGPKRQRVRIGHFPRTTLADARAAVQGARERRREEAAGTLELTVCELAEAYRRDILSHREVDSAEWSWTIIRVHILPALGERLAREVRPPDVAAVIRAAKERREVEVERGHGSKVLRRIGGPAVARAALAEIRAIFKAAVGTGTLEVSPASAIEAEPLGLRKRKRGRTLDFAEIGALFQALNLNDLLDGTAKREKLSEATRLGIALLLYCPVRSHSLIGARWGEFDLDAARWTVPVDRQKVSRAADREHARPFVVPLPATALEILKRLRGDASKSSFLLSSPRKPNVALNPKVLIRALARLQTTGRLALGSRFTIHDLRRTWRSWAGELGVSFEVAEKSLAHALPGVADTYARADMIEQRAAAADTVAAAFDRIRLGTNAKVVPLAAAKRAK